MITKKYLVAAIILTLLAAVVRAQDSSRAPQAMTADQKTAILKEFTRSGKLSGAMLNFVLLNDKTVEVLFSGAGKAAIRVQARMRTTFFVQGKAEKNITLDPNFVVEQDGKTYPGEAVNRKNLQAGAVVKGAQIEGFIQLGQKIDVTQSFKLKGANDMSVEFNLSPEAVKLLSN